MISINRNSVIKKVLKLDDDEEKKKKEQEAKEKKAAEEKKAQEAAQAKAANSATNNTALNPQRLSLNTPTDLTPKESTIDKLLGKKQTTEALKTASQKDTGYVTLDKRVQQDQQKKQTQQAKQTVQPTQTKKTQTTQPTQATQPTTKKTAAEEQKTTAASGTKFRLPGGKMVTVDQSPYLRRTGQLQKEAEDEVPDLLTNPQGYVEYLAKNRNDEQLALDKYATEKRLGVLEEKYSDEGKALLKEKNDAAAVEQAKYNILNTKGVPYSTRMGHYTYYDVNEWNEMYDEEFLKQRPADYDENYTEYDKALYDALYGQGAYDEAIQNTIKNRNRAEFDNEIDKLWEKVENHGFDEEELNATRAYQESYREQDDSELGKTRKYLDELNEIIANREFVKEMEKNAPEGDWAYDPSKAKASIFSTPDSADQVYIYSNIDLTDEDLNDFQRLGKLQPAQFMTEDQKNTFYGYYLSGDKESAQAYYDGLKNSLMEIRRDYRTALEERMMQDPLYSTIMTGSRILTKPMEGLVGAAQTAGSLLGIKGASDTNSELYDLAYTNRTVETERSKQWGESFANTLGNILGEDTAEKAGQLASSVFFSMADMAMASGLAGGSAALAQGGKAAKAAEGAIQFIMSSEAAANTLLEQIEDGKDPTEAALYAVGSGIIEAVTEKYSIEALLKPNVRELLGNKGQFIKYLTKNTFAEGSEEVAADVLNSALDFTLSIAYGHENEIQKTARQLMESGAYATEDEAYKAAWLNKLDQTLQSGVAGGFSGMLMSGAKGLQTRTQMAVENRGLAKQASSANVAENATESEKSTQAAVNRVNVVEMAKNMPLGTDSQEKGEAAYKKIMKGKEVSDAEYGGIIRAMINDTDERATNVVKNVLGQEIETRLKAMGEPAENIKTETASLVNMVAGVATQSDLLNYVKSKNMQTLLQEYKMTDEGIGQKRAEVEKETQKLDSIRENVAELLAKRPEVSTNAVKNVVKDAKVAAKSDIIAAGKSSGSVTEVLTDGKLKEIAGIRVEGEGEEKHIEVQFADNTSADIAQVAATNISVAQVLEYAGIDKGKTLTDKVANVLLKNVTKGADATKLIAGAVKISWDVATEQKTTNSGLNQATAEKIREAALADKRVAEEARQKNYRQINPGEGITTFKGVAYGTNAFNEAIRGLNKQTRNEAVTIAEIAKTAGFDVTLTNDAAKAKEQGSYSSENGIVINLAGEYRDGVARSAIATLAHEATHQLEGNSPEAYTALRSFVLQAQKRQGINLEERLQNIMNSYAKEGVELNMYDAVSELVAKSCEEVLTNEKIVNRMAEEDPTLYGKVKNTVSMIVGRVRQALTGVKTTSSIYAQTMREYSDKLADVWLSAYEEAKNPKKALQMDMEESSGNESHYGDHEQFSMRVDDENELKWLNNQETITTYKSMQLIDGKLYPPMAAVVAGSMEDHSELGQWEKATEHPELIKGGNKFTLNKGKGKGSLQAAYNPYMHSSNLMINDQFSGAYDRPNLVTVECKVPVSELTSGYKAEFAKDNTGWHSWHTGPVASALRNTNGTERQVMLSRWIQPVRIVPDAEVAQHYAQLLKDTDIAVPDNVITPALKEELIKAGVKIKESGRVQKSIQEYYSEVVPRGKKYFDNILNEHPDIQVVEIANPVSVPLNSKGEIDTNKVLQQTRSSKNIKVFNNEGKMGNRYYTYVPDLSIDVEIPSDGIRHNFSRDPSERTKNIDNAMVAQYAAEILPYAVEVNRGKAHKNKSYYEHVLVAGVRFTNGNNHQDFAVRFVVNNNIKQQPELQQMDIIGTLNSIKEKQAALSGLNSKNADRTTAHPTYNIKLSKFFDDVKNDLNDTFAEEVYRNAGIQRDNRGFGKNLMYSVQESDEEYMAAVDNGDMNTAQRMVDAAAEKAMPDSKMRTKDGKLRKLYHGTWSDTFTEFDPKWIGSAREGDTGFFGRGFYFAYSKGEASFYGGNVMEVFLNIKNPFNFRNEFHYLDGMETNDYNASRAVFVANFADKFPELANKHTVRVFEKGSDEAKELSLKEFADEFKKIVKEKKFKVNKTEGYDGVEWVATTDRKEMSFTNEDGETFTWPEYGYQKRYASEKDAKNQLTNAYEYMANTVYDYISIQNTTIIIMETDFSKEVQKRGYDGIIQSEDGDEAVVFDSSQIKLADAVTYDDQGKVIPLSERFNPKRKDIRYSVQETDEGYMQAVNAGNMDAAQKVVDAYADKNGYTIRAFHGTGRADRVGTVFLPERATSGPMAFFTDSREIAENYSKDKKDTSITYDEDYGDYHTQFRYNLNGKNIPVEKLWDKLDWKSRQKIIEAGKHINFDEEMEDIIYDENAKYGPGGFTENELRYHRGNAIDTLIYVWLDSANLWGREGDFIKVMEMAGIKGVTWNDPDARVEKVYDTYLKIQNPFIVNDMYTEEFLQDLQEWWDEQEQDKYAKEDLGADFWDKNGITVDEWIEHGHRDIENGTTHNWTRIPDGVTAYLKEKGYDGIKDQGGKNGGAGHTVWIPFTSEQIKSAETITYDDDGNIITPSERFNPEKKDIRWSIQDETDQDIRSWMMTVKADALQNDAERALLKRWQDMNTKVELKAKQIHELQTKIAQMKEMVRKDDFKNNSKDAQRKIREWTVQLENARTVRDQAQAELARIESEEGYGRMMQAQTRRFNEFQSGKTQAEVAEEIGNLQKASEKISKEIGAAEKRIAEIKNKGIIENLKRILGTTTADQTAAELKREFSSSWTKGQIRNYLDPILLKLANGGDITSDVEELAGILISSDTRYTNETLAGLRGLVITLGKGAQKELKAQDSSLKEIRARLAGTGITVKYGDRSTLEADIEDLREQYPDMPEMGSDKDALENFVSWVEGLKRSGADEFYDERLAEAMAQIYGKVIATAKGIYVPTEARAQKQVMALVNFVKDLNAETDEAVQTLQKIGGEAQKMFGSGKNANEAAQKLIGNMNEALEYYNLSAKLAMQHAKQERNNAIIEQLKSKHAQEIAKRNTEWRELMERDAEARKTAESIRGMQSRMNTALKRTYRLLTKPKGLQNIPEPVQGLARELVKTFVDNDLAEGYRTKLTLADKGQLEEAQRILQAMEEESGPYDPLQLNGAEEAVQSVAGMDLATIQRCINRLSEPITGKNRLDTMQRKAAILEEMTDAVTEIYRMIRKEGEINIRDRQIAAEDQADKVMRDTKGQKYREWTGKAGNTIRTLHKAIVGGNMTPEYFFRMLGNEGLSELWENYHDAENRNGLALKAAKDRLAEIAEKYGYDKWDMKQRITLKLENGDVDVTLGQLMSLWATWKRETATKEAMTQHLTEGGFYAAPDLQTGILGRQAFEKKATRIRATQSEDGTWESKDMALVESLLTDEQLKFIDDVVSYMSNEMSELGNEASLKAFGIRLYKEKYYFPFQVWNGVKSQKSNESGVNAGQDRAFHQSFTHALTHKAKNAIMMDDFMKTAVDHIYGMINYATMGLANENLQKVLNVQLYENVDTEGFSGTKRNLQAILEEAYGKEAMQYLNELKTQLNGGAVRVDKTFYDRLISLFRKNAVAGSLSVALQQPLSYIRASMLMNPKYLAQALNPIYWKGSYAEMLKHSGVAVIKDMSRFDMNFGQSAREFLMPETMESTPRQIWNAVEDYSTKLPERMDRMTWTRMWSAVKAEQKAQHPEMDTKSEEFLDRCGERFNEIMRRTQVYDSVLVKSANMRSQSTPVKMITSFMAEPTLTLNVLADSVRMAKNHEKGGAGMVGKAAATFLLSAVLQAFVKGLMGSGRNPDDKKTWLENFLYRFEYNFLNEADPLQLIPGFGDLVTYLKGGELKDDAYGTIRKMLDAAGGVAGLITGEKELGWQSVEDSIGQLIQLFSGVPAKNISRDTRAMWNFFIGRPYAEREDNVDVMLGQAKDLFYNADNLIGVLNKWLGEAGYDTSKNGYYRQIYDAKKEGRYEDAQSMIDYLIYGKGVTEEAINNKMNTLTKEDDSLTAEEKADMLIINGASSADDYIRQQLREGNMTAEEARRTLLYAQPGKTVNDVWWQVDRIEYQMETGAEKAPGGNAYYYRLTDAINANKSAEIKTAVQQLMNHGITKDKIKGKLSDWKKEYLAAKGNKKVAIKNALIIAYKAIGISEKDANEIINKWK